MAYKDPSGNCWTCESQSDWDNYNKEQADKNHEKAESIRKGDDVISFVRREFFSSDEFFEARAKEYRSRVGVSKEAQGLSPEAVDTLFAVTTIVGARVAYKKAPKEVGVTNDVTISRSRFPETARHVEDAVNAGKPSTLTIDRANAASRRREAQRGTETRPGFDRDEYPPAMFQEGGRGASVRHINPSDNRGAGACIGGQCRDLPDGTRVRIEVVD
ncbi:NucA/NucB deoxyribonuclease domain-containing protein [Pannonibacter phragmitetus]|uniref:NucA/NucB deoxyribonuclease domain-containing protein n=1 Tax=Pannonibacter phragmitetus TaxID=121719 RepID=UPI001969A881|nr:NucA/NucB deoxyribonuclease domain-containing protein [Pannonibacter phragmitetus]